MDARLHIRPATPADVEALASLYARFLDSQFALADLGPRNDDFDVRAYVLARLGRPGMVVFLATCDGVPAGFSDCSLTRPASQFQPQLGGKLGVRAQAQALLQRLRDRPQTRYLADRAVGYLHNSFVHPDFRGLGLGTQLTTVRVDWLRAADAALIEVHTLFDNVPAQRVFWANGMRPFSLLMRWLPADQRTAWDDAHPEVVARLGRTPKVADRLP